MTLIPRVFDFSNHLEKAKTIGFGSNAVFFFLSLPLGVSKIFIIKKNPNNFQITHESQCFAGQRVPFGTSITHWFILLNQMHTRLLQPP